MVEEYCEVITQAAGQSSCSQSGSSVGFNHTPLNIKALSSDAKTFKSTLKRYLLEHVFIA